MRPTPFDKTSWLQNTPPFYRFYDRNLNQFADLLDQRMDSLSHSTLSPANVDSVFRAYANQLSESGAWQREVEKWSGNPVALAENPHTETRYITYFLCNNLEAMGIDFDPIEQEEEAPPTKIETRTSTHSAHAPKYYSLSGQQLKAPTRHGLCISNGRLVMTK